MAERRQYSRYGSGYATRGNLAAAPRRAERERRRLEKEYLQHSRLQIEEKVLASGRLEKVYSRAQLLVLSLSLAVLLAVGSVYVMQLSVSKAGADRAAVLMEQYQELIKDNASLKNQYEGKIDYEGVYEYAVSKGMMTPGKQQIVTYQRSNPEYVAKDGMIPYEK